MDVVLEDDEASGEVLGLCEGCVEGRLVRDGRDLVTMDTPVVQIPLLNNAITVVVRDRSPEGRDEIHCLSGCTDTIIDITVRGRKRMGVTPVKSLIALRVQPSSATTCPLVRE